MTTQDIRDDLAALADLGFLRPKFFAHDHWAALILNAPGASIVDGHRDALAYGYQNRWQYPSLADAAEAFQDWSGEGQPKGWTSAHIDQDALTVWP